MYLVTLNLDKIFNPKSIAVVGANDEEGTVGYKLINKKLQVNVDFSEIIDKTFDRILIFNES